MKINGKTTIQLFNSDGKEVYGTAEGEGIVDFESLLTNSVIPNNPDSIFDIKHRKRADDAKVVEEVRRMTNKEAIAILENLKTQDEAFFSRRLALDRGIEALEVVEKIKKVLTNTKIDAIDNAPTVPLPDFKDGYKQAIIDGKTNFAPCYQTTSCLDCRMYDKENHYCPRFCEVIREIVKEVQEANNE